MSQYQPQNLDLAALESKPIVEDITVVIPTLGRPILEECLHWLAAGSAWPGGLIVVDQGRNPQVASWLDELQSTGIKTHYFPSDQRGRASGVNRGLELAQTRFVAVTDDDCFVDEDWLENMINHLRQNPKAIVTGRVEAGTDDVIVVVTSQTPSVQRRPYLTFDHMSGGNMGTSLDVLNKIGLLDEDPRVRTAEDGEFAYRALRAGVPIIYAPDVALRHFGWRDEGQRSDQYRDYAISHGGFYGKYLRKGDWFIALRVGVHYLRAIRRLIRGTLNRNAELQSIGRAYVTGLLPGIISGMQDGKDQ
jgi:GT2 family glycosyltransferase